MRNNINRINLFLIAVIVIVILGLAGADDLQTQIASDIETAEIKAAMKQRSFDEKRCAEEYRQLFLNRGGVNESE